MHALLRQPGLESVVVFRALQLGDMLCAVPALRALRLALPQARITLVGLPWAAQFAARFSAHVDDFVAFPGHPGLPEQPAQPEGLEPFLAGMRDRHFDLALQLHGSGEVSNAIVRAFGARQAAGYASAAVAADGFCALPYPAEGPEPLRLLGLMTALGAPDAGHALEFPLLPADWEELAASGLAAGLEPGRYLCVHAGARFRDKCWPPACFARIADRLAAEYALVPVLTGSEKERDLAEAVAAHMKTPAVNAAGPISIGAMAALMSGARLLVCNDTGVSHIAAGLGLRSVVVFSKANLTRWAPLDQGLHRCVHDPCGEKACEVLAEAWRLLAAAAIPRTAAAPAS
jgi:ADP-heptose:LPS heptosyltransferase